MVSARAGWPHRQLLLPAQRREGRLGRTWPSSITSTRATRKGLYRYCLSVVEHLLALGFEGFRCDAAYQVPRNFWHRLIRDIKRRHHAHLFRRRNPRLLRRPDAGDRPRRLRLRLQQLQVVELPGLVADRAIQPRARDHPLHQLPRKPRHAPALPGTERQPRRRSSSAISSPPSSPPAS